MNELNYLKALKTLNVLYCEDEAAPRRQMKIVLEDIVKNLYVGEDGVEGLELFKKHSPDLIITDIKMPKMDGLLMCEEIKKIDPKANIILLTAFDYKNFFQKAIDIGVSQYVIKPIGEGKLFNAIHRTLETIMAKKKVDYQSMYIQSILDAQKNLVLVTDGKNIQAANKAFLKFFDYDSLGKLLVDKMGNMQESIQFEEGRFVNAARFLLELNDFIDQKIVIYIEKERENVPFTCEVTKLEEIEGRYLVSLNDVSKLEYFAKKSLLPVKEEMLSVDESEESFVEDEIDITIDSLSSDILGVEDICEKDSLTNYYNQESFYERLEDFVASGGESFSFLVFSFKNFKEINKTNGFEFGDEVIRELTRYFNDEFLYDSLFVRFAGVEFGVLIKSQEDEKDGIKSNLGDISKELNQRLISYNEKCRCSFSHFSVKADKVVSLISAIRVKHITTKGS